MLPDFAILLFADQTKTRKKGAPREIELKWSCVAGYERFEPRTSKMPSNVEYSLPSPEGELELLLNLLDDATSDHAEEKLRMVYAPRVSRFLRKEWPGGLPSEITNLTDWALQSFVQATKENVINGDEPIAVVMIRLAKTGLKEYLSVLDGKLPTPQQQSSHEKTDLWFEWELVCLDGKAQHVAQCAKDLLSKSKLGCFVLRAMYDGNGTLSDSQLIKKVRQISGQLNATAVEILLIRDELRSAMRSKIKEMRKLPK
jgi:hypothetical protein